MKKQGCWFLSQPCLIYTAGACREDMREDLGKVKDFLKKYDTIIFDMDGVITSESAYWDAAALTVYQQLGADRLFCDCVDVEYYMNHIKEIREEVFSHDKLIEVLKNKGVNSNWDLAYVTLGIAIIMRTRDFGEVLRYAQELPDDVFEIYKDIARGIEERTGMADASRSSGFWQKLRMRFQEWILGDVLFRKVYGCDVSQSGKEGILAGEQPVVDGEKLKNVIFGLHKEGKRLCTATGRIWEELKSPLERFGIIGYFAKNGFINFNHVMNAEKKLGIPLTKPHPYMFLKALCGEEYDDKDITEGIFDKEPIKKTLVVGDAGADILAAKAMGADFCAVLTGVNGKAARGYFEDLGAEYILDSILDFE